MLFVAKLRKKSRYLPKLASSPLITLLNIGSLNPHTGGSRNAGTKSSLVPNVDLNALELAGIGHQTYEETIQIVIHNKRDIVMDKVSARVELWLRFTLSYVDQSVLKKNQCYASDRNAFY